MTRPFAAAIRQLVQGVQDASTFTDPNLNSGAIVRARLAKRDTAIAEFSKAIPTPAGEPGAASAEYAASVGPKTPDQIAVATFERDNVERQLAAGRPLHEVIQSLPESALIALLALAETLSTVLADPQPAEAAVSVRQKAFDQLAHIGVSGAQEAVQRDQASVLDAAIRNTMTGLLTAGPDARDLNVIHQLDPEGYAGAFAEGVPRLGNVIEQIGWGARGADS